MTVLIKNPRASAGDVRDTGSIPGSGRSPGGGNGTHSSVFAWKIPWAEEPGGLSPWGSKELDTTEQRSTYTDIPGGAVDRNPPASAGDRGSIPGLGRFPVPWGS